ncbi:MAG TPA: hypothetical protein VGJ86_05315 [Acidimicrobiales bacterium]|jgi:hypothetical protein
MSETTTDITPDQITETIDTYLASLNELDAAKRTALIEQAWVADGTFLDPLLDVQGHTALGEIAVLVDQHYPGHGFRRTTAVDVHHNRVRFGWELVGPDNAVAVAGIDVGQVAEDGRLRSIVGFFGDLTPA